MKTKEKSKRYTLLPFAHLMHGLKNAGKFVGKKSKSAISMLVAVALLVSLMPITVFAASSDVIVGGANL